MNRYRYFEILAAAGFITFACSVYTEDLVGQSTGPSQGGSAGTSNAGDGGNGAGGTNGGSSGLITTGGTGGTGNTGGTNPDAGGTGGDPNVCAGSPSKTLPPPPDPGSVVNADFEIAPFSFAMYTIDLGDRPPDVPPPTDYLGVGFNLDNTCNDSERGAGECVLADWAKGTLDGPGGVDNALGAIVQNTRAIVGDFSSDRYTMEIQAGKTNVLFRVSKYNGEANDDLVEVALFVAAPYSEYSPDPPNWDAVVPMFPIASDSVTNPADPLNTPKFVDRLAYVTNSQLVVTYPRASLRLDVALSAVATVKLKMELSRAYMVCDLQPSPIPGGVFDSNNCTIAGRWETNHLLKQLSQFSDPSDGAGAPLCTDNPLYKQFKRPMCNLTDSDTIGSETNRFTCNALSVGINFTARPVEIGNVFILDPLPPRCSDATDTKWDCCENLNPDPNITEPVAGVECPPPPAEF